MTCVCSQLVYVLFRRWWETGFSVAPLRQQYDISRHAVCWLGTHRGGTKYARHRSRHLESRPHSVVWPPLGQTRLELGRFGQTWPEFGKHVARMRPHFSEFCQLGGNFGHIWPRFGQICTISGRTRPNMPFCVAGFAQLWSTLSNLGLDSATLCTNTSTFGRFRPNLVH